MRWIIMKRNASSFCSRRHRNVSEENPLLLHRVVRIWPHQCATPCMAQGRNDGTFHRTPGREPIVFRTAANGWGRGGSLGTINCAARKSRKDSRIELAL